MAGKISSKIKSTTQENTVGVIALLVTLLVILLVVVVSIKIASNKRAQNLGLVETSESSEEVGMDLRSNPETSSVKFYMEKGVVADEKHSSIEMTISANNRTIRVLKGYENVEQRSQGLDNNLEAYKAFLEALNKYSFGESRIDKSGFAYREACPTEKLYRFSMMDDANQVFDRWYTFCNNTRYGDFGGKVNLTFALFRNQFPEYGKYTSGSGL